MQEKSVSTRDEAYVVFKGNKPGVYRFYSTLQKSIKDYKNPEYKTYETYQKALAEAYEYFLEEGNTEFYIENPRSEELMKGYNFLRMEKNIHYFKQQHESSRKRVQELEKQNQNLQAQLAKRSFTEEELVEDFQKIINIKNFLEDFPEEIRQKIVSTAENKLTADLMALQQFIKDNMKKLFKVSRYYETSDLTPGSRLLVEVEDPQYHMLDLYEEFFYNGMLLKYVIKEKCPEFFGDRIKFLVDNVSTLNFKQKTLLIFSSIPQIINEEYVPAVHQIILFIGEDENSFHFLYGGENNISEDFLKFDRIYSEFPHDLGDHLQLLGETEDTKLWVKNYWRSHPDILQKDKFAASSSRQPSPFVYDKEDDEDEMLC